MRTLSARRTVRATADVIFDAVSDLDRMASWSEEYIGSWRLWRGEPRPGVRFIGWNRSGWWVWFTTCRVVAADRPDRFVFESGILGLPIARWSYRITGTSAGGCEVVERWDDLRDEGSRGGIARLLGRAFTGATAQQRVQRNATGMRVTLDRLAADVASS